MRLPPQLPRGHIKGILWGCLVLAALLLFFLAIRDGSSRADLLGFQLGFVGLGLSAVLRSLIWWGRMWFA